MLEEMGDVLRVNRANTKNQVILKLCIERFLFSPKDGKIFLSGVR